MPGVVKRQTCGHAVTVRSYELLSYHLIHEKALYQSANRSPLESSYLGLKLHWWYILGKWPHHSVQNKCRMKVLAISPSPFALRIMRLFSVRHFARVPWMLVIIINRPLMVSHGSLLERFLLEAYWGPTGSYSLSLFGDHYPQLQTHLSPSWYLLQWPPSFRMKTFWAPDSVGLFLPAWHLGWRMLLWELFGPNSTIASQPLWLIPKSQGNVMGHLSPGLLRVYGRKGESHTRNTYVADFTWFIRKTSSNNKSIFSA